MCHTQRCIDLGIDRAEEARYSEPTVADVLVVEGLSPEVLRAVGRYYGPKGEAYNRGFRDGQFAEQKRANRLKA